MWAEEFQDVSGLRKSLRGWQSFDVDDLRQDPERGRLLRRAEIFTSLGMTQYAVSALDELQKTFDVASGSERDTRWGLYISRLYAAAGQWLGAIAMTTKLSKDPEFWRKRPEQMLIYFPRPHLSLYKAVAADMALDWNMLMGISRQESSFKADIRSGANAWGLMQLAPPTAKRLLPNAGFPDSTLINIPDGLLRPDINIRFGATFVRELAERFSGSRAQMFAAYNAGSQTVDNWVARRLFEDQLLFIEMIPYQETRDYVKGVWRNEVVYGHLSKNAPQ